MSDFSWNVSGDTLCVYFYTNLYPQDVKIENVKYWWIDVYYKSSKIDSVVVKNENQKSFYFLKNKRDYQINQMFTMIYTYYKF